MRFETRDFAWGALGAAAVVGAVVVVTRHLWEALAVAVLVLLVWLGSKRKPVQPIVRINNEGVFVETPGREAQAIPWADLIEVGIVTTSDGPWLDDVFWILRGEKHDCVVAGAQGEELLKHLGRLPRFDHEQVIRAMGSTSEASFRCWTGVPGEGLSAATAAD
jgi:hypothetical protein